MIGYIYLTINDVNNICYIGECCRHERKTAYGYKWEFAETRWVI